MKKQLTVEGMSCQHCVNRVKNALKELKGTTEVEVDLDKKTVFVQLDDDVEDTKIKEALEEHGYDVTAIRNA